MADDMENLRGVLLGLGLNALPQLLQKFHAVRNAGRNLEGGRSHKDDGPSTKDQASPPDAYALQSQLAPLLAQLQGGGGQTPMPVNTPGMRPGMPPAPLPRTPGFPRTMHAGASPSGF
jgi:hypothetical protein